MSRMLKSIQNTIILILVMLLCLNQAGGVSAGVFEWTSNGPEGGTIFSFAIDPAAPSTVYATTYGGVYKSTDGGGTWERRSTGLTNPVVYTIVIDPTTPNTLYAGGWMGGVYKSLDGGGSWAPVNNGLSHLIVYTLAIDPSTPSTLYAGTFSGGVYKSTDGGEEWNPVNSGLTNLLVVALVVDPTTPATLYAGTNGGGVFKSTNGGGTWGPVNVGLGNLQIKKLVVHPTTPETVYAGTYGGGVYKTEDGGDNWGAASTGIVYPYVLSLAMDPSAPETLYAGTDGTCIWKTTNGGDNWGGICGGPTNHYFRSLIVNPVNSAIVFAGSDGGGIYKSVNSGASWSMANTGLLATSVTSILIDPADDTILFAGTIGAGVFKSTDNGASWVATNNDYDSLYILSMAMPAAQSSTIYAGTSGRGVYKTINGGEDWFSINSGMTAIYIEALAIDPETQATVYAGTFNNGVFKSVNGGGEWGSSSVGLTNSYVWDLAINPVTPSTLYAATDGGVFVSTDSAANWTPANEGLTSLTVRALVINAAAPATVYAGTGGGGIFKTIDGGSHWTAVNTGLGDLNVLDLAMDPDTPAILYAGTRGGVYKSTDGGDEWIALDTGLSIDTIRQIAINPEIPSTIYAGTDGGGLFVLQQVALPVCYTLDVALDPAAGGSVLAEPSTDCVTELHEGGYTDGTEVTLTAGANEHYAFSDWSGDVIGTDNPVPIIMDANKTVTANYTQDEYTLTVNITGNGTVGRSIPEPYHWGDVVDLTPDPDEGWSFSEWTGACTGSGACSVAMDDDKTVGATFTQDEYTLTLNFTGNGGIATSIPAPYHWGDVVDLTPEAIQGWSFSAWSGACTGSGACSVTMDDDQTVGATFTQDEYTLTVNITGNGTVDRSIPEPYYWGDVVDLTSDPDAGWIFSAWSGACTGSGACSVTMNGNQTVGATFTETGPACYALTLSHVGSGSDPVATPGNSTGCPAGEYLADEDISLLASPAGGWIVDSWIGTDNNASTSTGNTVTMPAGIHTVIVNYEAIAAPGAFAKLGPASGIYGSPSGVTLTWEASSGATGYEYCYDTSDNGVCNSAWTDAGTATSAEISGLSLSSTYYWQVRARNANPEMTYANGGTGTGTWWTLKTGLFADVPVAGKEWMRNWIEGFYNAGITTGCGASPRIYCPEREVTRAEMAVFLLRAKHGAGYVPPAATGVFGDVPFAGKEWMQPWIEQFYREGITTGCGAGPIYCPERNVTRAEMAVFVLRAKHGAAYVPPAATGVFLDVPVTGKEWMQPWIEQFYREGITTGCGAGPLYCPERNVTRAEMAVFLGRAYSIPQAP